MLKSNNSLTLSLAIELGFLDDQQLQQILAGSEGSKSSEIEIAVRKGFLSGQELRILESFESLSLIHISEPTRPY